MEDIKNKILQLKKTILTEKYYKIELYIDNYYIDFPNCSFLEAKNYANKKAQENINKCEKKIKELNDLLDREINLKLQKNNTSLNQFINVA